MIDVVIQLLRTKDRINLGQYYEVKGARSSTTASQPLALAVARNADAAHLLTIVAVLNSTVFQRHET